jgi:hypothetical protein
MSLLFLFRQESVQTRNATQDSLKTQPKMTRK